jgi:raffinose/stachyose/melibiose transport system substrate-binding protein
MANADLFDKAGAEIAPKDWDGFLAMCEKLAASGVIPISWPAATSETAASCSTA